MKQFNCINELITTTYSVMLVTLR